VPGARGRGLSLALALLLAGVTVGAVVRARGIDPSPPPRGPAADLARRLASGLLALERPDGSYDRLPGERDMEPEVRGTVASALAIAAIARLQRMGLEVPGMDEAVARGLGFLAKRQAAGRGGAFGAMPAGIQSSPWPAVHAVSAGMMAVCAARDPGHAAVLDGATSAFERAVTYGVPKGWTRGLAAMAGAYVADACPERWRRPLAGLLEETPADAEQVDCGDFRLSEAILQVARRGRSTPFAEQVVQACTADPEFPRWSGDSSDVQAWWMQAWLAARTGGEAARLWFARVLPALEEARKALGRIPEGYYGDTVTQTACGVLVLVEGLEAGLL
jgi:hypothetical protein